MLDAVRLNLNQQRRDLKLFEVGKDICRQPQREEVTCGNREPDLGLDRQRKFGEQDALATRELDFYDAKGAIEAALEAVNIRSAQFSAADCRPSTKWTVGRDLDVRPKPVGYVGRLNQDIASMYKFRQPVFVAELNLEAVLALPRNGR